MEMKDRVYRVCSVCGEQEGREATPYELMHMTTPPKFIKQKDEYGEWAGKYICTTCKSRENSRERNRWKTKMWEKKNIRGMDRKRRCGKRKV